MRNEQIVDCEATVDRLSERVESSRPCALGVCWLLKTSVQEIDMLRANEQASLPKQVRCEYNQ
jgi:hypothetical protein